MSDEPSYYEVALTNRQVLVSFVVLLGCVLSAFVAGVWVGRMDRETQVAKSAPAPAPEVEVEAGELAGLEEFQFPSDDSAELRKPDLSELRGNPGAEAAAAPPSRQEPPAAGDSGGDAPPPPPPAAPPAPRPSPPPPAPPPRQAAPPQADPPVPVTAPREELIIQVFSSRDEDQAKKVIANLKKGGHRAYMAPVVLGGQTTTFRVRIGPFTSRAEAEKAAAEIRREFKLETWVTAATN